MPQWFETGMQGVEREKIEREKKRNVPWRFFLKVGQSTRIVFLDDFTRVRAVELPGSGEVIKQPVVPFCFPAGAQVLTDAGALSIESVIAGQRVMRKDGTWGTVSQLHHRKYDGRMVSARVAKSSEPIVGTADHRVPVVEVSACIHTSPKSRNRKYCAPSCKVSCSKASREYSVVEKRLGDLVEGDFLLMPGAHNCPAPATIEHPAGMGRDVVSHSSKVTEELAWLVGMYVAEGCHHHGPTFSLHREETDIQEAISELMESIFGLDAHIVDHPTSQERQVCFYATEVGKWFENECGKHANNKRFPQWVMEAPRPIQAAALDGYLAGDGNHYEGRRDRTSRTMAATVSKTLAYQVRALAIALGKKPSFSVRPASIDSNGVSRQESYWISWSMNSKFTDGFFLDGMLAVPVLSVESYDVVDTDVYNLGVDGEHFYTVNGIAVHNCFNEHNLTIDGDWKNWFTCLAKIDPPCPICSNGHYKYYIGMYTVLAEWQDQDGVAHWSKRLFAAKIDAIERIRMKQGQYKKDGRIADGQFQYGMFHVSRSGERSVVTGDDLEFIRTLSREEAEGLLPAPQQGQEPLTVDPYDYMKLFEPKSKADLDKLLRSGRVQPPRDKKSGVAAKPDAFGGKSTVSSSASDVGGTDGASDGETAADAIEF